MKIFLCFMIAVNVFCVGLAILTFLKYVIIERDLKQQIDDLEEELECVKRFRPHITCKNGQYVDESEKEYKLSNEDKKTVKKANK